MRNIKDYENKYKDEPFEDIMVGIRRNVVIANCRKYPHENILEIGCGLEPLFLHLDDFQNMVICEPAEQFADNARSLARESGKNKKIDVVSGFFEECTEKIKGIGVDFDLIILSSVLHELDDPQKMLMAIRNLCSDRTVVHINVPNANSLHRLLAVKMGMIKDVHVQSQQMKRMQRRRTYDMDLLIREVEEAGFVIEDRGSYFIKPFTHEQMQRCLDEGIINTQVLDGLEKLSDFLPDFGAGIYVNVVK